MIVMGHTHNVCWDTYSAARVLDQYWVRIRDRHEPKSFSGLFSVTYLTDPRSAERNVYSEKFSASLFERHCEFWDNFLGWQGRAQWPCLLRALSHS